MEPTPNVISKPEPVTTASRIIAQTNQIRSKQRPNRTVRSSFRKSTYTMLRVDTEALQKIKLDKDVELLSIETSESGEHVVFVSAKSALGQETQALEKLKGFELVSTRKNRSKSNAVNLNRRSIFLTDASKIFTEGAIDEAAENDTNQIDDNVASRQRRAFTYNITETTKQPENITLPPLKQHTPTPSILPPITIPNNTNPLLNQSIKSPSENRSSAKWKVANHFKHSPVAEEEVSNNDSSSDTEKSGTMDSPKSSSWTQNQTAAKDGNSKDKGRKPMKLVVVTPMGSRRPTVDFHSTEDA